MTQPSLVPVILSGGAGTRLWPVSREAAPKPFMPLPDGETLLGKTAARALALPRRRRARHRHQPRLLLPHERRVRGAGRAGRERPRYLLEPFGRNTAPAIAIGARCGPSESRPATHAAGAAGRPPDPPTRPHSADGAHARAGARAGRLAGDLRHPAHAPETGFGYIEMRRRRWPAARRAGCAASSRSPTPRGRSSTCRPATSSGTAACSASGPRAHPRRLRAPSHPRCSRGSQRLAGEPAQPRRRARSSRSTPSAFAALPEHLDRLRGDGEGRQACVVLPLALRLERHRLVEGGRRAAAGRRRRQSQRTATRCWSTRATRYVQSEDRLVAAVGVDDLLVVDTPDALLVAHQDRASRSRKSSAG